MILTLNLQNITKDAYQKISGSREIGVRLSAASNTSKSFQVFIHSIQEMVREMEIAPPETGGGGNHGA